jgi:hypothetical protein
MAVLSQFRRIITDLFVFQVEHDFPEGDARLQSNKYCAREHPAWQAA